MLEYSLEKNGLFYNLECISSSSDFSKLYDFKVKKDIDEVIINEIFKIDGTVQKFLNKNIKLTFQIQNFNTSVRSNRFKTIIPLLVKPKKIFNSAYPYQNEGINWLFSNKKCILADDMGLGKTLQCLAALTKKYYEHLISKAIIFCPNNLLKTWGAEIENWCPHFKYSELNSIDIRKNLTIKIFNSNNILLIPYSASVEFFKIIEKKKNFVR